MTTEDSPGPAPDPERPGGSPGIADPREALGAPSFGALIRGNLRVVGVATILAAGCYGIWRGLRLLFPDVSWLQ